MHGQNHIKSIINIMRINDTVKATLMKVCFIHWIWH